MMREDSGSPIDLAQVEDFSLGAMAVCPSGREVTRGDWREMLEPRVMQVLVALHQANGAVVSRDELIARCWEGRIVGEDAINRAIGRIRRLSESDNGASFAVETIPRVGYRLRAAGSKTAAPLPDTTQVAPRTPNRRLLLAGAAGAVALGTAGGGFFFWRRHEAAQTVPPEIAAMIEQGKRAQRMATAESQAQAIGILEHVVQVAPNVADGWGALGRTYAIASHMNRTGTDALRLRADAAIARAVELEPGNDLAAVARVQLLPQRGAWQEKDRILKQGLAAHPDSPELLVSGAEFQMSVGRHRQAADMALRGGAKVSALDPFTGFVQIVSCWGAGRLAEADHAAA